MGLVEELSPFKVRGWAFDPQQPGLALDLLLRIDGQTVMAFRPQLRMPAMAEYLGTRVKRLGLVCFEVAPPESLADGKVHRVEVVVASTGAALKALTTEVQYRNPYLPLDEALPRSTGRGHSRQRSQAPAVSVVVLNRNGSALLHALLESWQRHNHTVRAEWVVIDHASTDDSLKMLRAWQHRLPLRVKALSTNDSFSASCNRGARMARGRYLLFLNNDLVWLHDALPELLRTLENPAVGIAGLKLLKPAEGPGGQCWTEVQHLGVRFKQRHTGYRPYEATPSRHNREAEYTPQLVPAVTGAALMCRKADFLAVGGFDRGYFYGFEDIEFCLRLAHRTRRRVVCRNDLTALHHDGHTRLTGREAGIEARIERNADVLDRHVGLWIKRAWWASLLAGDNLLCSEPLTIGLVVDQLPPAHGRRAAGSAQLADMLTLGEQLRRHWPHARVLLLHPAVDPHEARALHLLVVGDPHYDTAAVRNARPDLRMVAWMRGRPQAWVGHTGWMDFDAYVAANRATARSLAKLTPIPTAVHRADAPLEMLHQWRVMVCLGDKKSGNAVNGESAPDARALAAARTLRDALKAQGVPCWLGWKEDAQRPDPRPNKVVEVCVYVLPGKRLPHTFDPATLNVVWRLSPHSGMSRVSSSRRAELAPEGFNPGPGSRHGLDSGSLSGMTNGVDLVVDRMPTAALLEQALEKRIGRTFSAS